MSKQQLPEADSDPWIAHGSCSPEHEDALIGDRRGLEILKARIEEALRSGEAEINEPGIEFVAVRVVGTDPRTENEQKGNRVSDRVFMLGCGTLLFLVVFVLVAGIRAIWSWF